MKNIFTQKRLSSAKVTPFIGLPFLTGRFSDEFGTWRRSSWRNYTLNTLAKVMESSRDSNAVSKKASRSLIAITMILILPVAYADQVTMDIKGKPLYVVMREVHALSGAEIKVPQNLAGDLISRSVREDTWKTALAHLLLGYNYVVAWGNKGLPHQIIVFSRNQNADELMTIQTVRTESSEDLLIYDEPTQFSLPEKYQGFNPSSLSSVSIPVERMKQMAIGEKVSLNLPVGQFEVVHDKQFQYENGDVTWVGYLETAGKDYRVIITMGSNGNLGHGQVVTPQGMYNLDTQEGHTWLVDVNTASLQSSEEIVSN